MAAEPIEQITIPNIEAFQAKLRLPNCDWLAKYSLLVAAVAEGTSSLSGSLFSDQSLRLISALNTLGFQIDMEIEDLQCRTQVTGSRGAVPGNDAHLNIGDDLDTLTLLTTLCAIGSGQVILEGGNTLHKVNLQPLFQPLIELGAKINFLKQPGCLPIQIEGGHLSGGTIQLDAFMPGKIINAILVIAPYLRDGLKIEFIKPIRFRPRMEMTLLLMQQFGVLVDVNETFTCLNIEPDCYNAAKHIIEPDATIAACFLAAAAITHRSRCTLLDIGSTSVQPNASFALVLQDMGATATYDEHTVTVESPSIGRLMGIDVDMSRMLDLTYILAATAVFADAPTTIRNVGRLRKLNDDPLLAISSSLASIGVDVEIENNNLIIAPIPARELLPATIDPGDNPLLAMCFAAIGLQTGHITIRRPDCVNKIAPSFFDYLKLLQPKSAIRNISPTQLPGFTIALGEET